MTADTAVGMAADMAAGSAADTAADMQVYSVAGMAADTQAYRKPIAAVPEPLPIIPLRIGNRT